MVKRSFVYQQTVVGLFMCLMQKRWEDIEDDNADLK